MCGGAGSRLDAPVEKPLLEVGGRPMVDRVAAALDGSRVGTTYAVVSPLAPDTRDHVALPTVETPGDGYVADVERATDAVGTPVLTVAADLPLLSPGLVDEMLDAHGAGDGGSLAACVPAGLKRRLGASVDETWTTAGRELAAVGMNVVVDDRDAVHLSHDARLAVNVNRRSDVALAEALL